MRVATWNVNSIRARFERVVAFAVEADIDVLAMQETKCKDEAFPLEPFEQAGYQVAHWGLSQWNGVAIASRVGLADVQSAFPGQPAWKEAVEARALAATCAGLRVWSLYVPHGRALDDPHMAYKLAWLAALRSEAEGWLAQDAPIALLGDWNVAPLDEDVWDIEVFTGGPHVSPPERAAFAEFARIGYVEVSRVFRPEPHTYTYWDYQRLRFPRNEGMRIDFAYLSPAAANATTDVQIVRNQRKGKGPSDHVPVVLDINIPTAVQ